MVLLPEKNHQGPVTIADGLTFEWLHDGKIAFYTLTSIRREVLSMYVDTVKAVGEGWEAGTPYLSIHDISEIGMTPSVRKEAERATHYVEHLEGYLAVIVPHNVLGHALKLFVDIDIRRRAPKRVPRICFSYDEALHWIESHLKK